MDMDLKQENTNPIEKEDAEIDWVPLARAIEGTEIELMRGFLEAQDIPVQLQVTLGGESNLQAFNLAIPQRDIYVPRENSVAAKEALSGIRKLEPLQEDAEIISVYDEVGNQQELDISGLGKCPCCGRSGLVHKPAQEIGCLTYLVVLMGVGAIFELSWHIFKGMTSFYILFLLTIPFIVILSKEAQALYLEPESWRCEHCGQEWHK